MEHNILEAISDLRNMISVYLILITVYFQCYNEGMIMGGK